LAAAGEDGDSQALVPPTWPTPLFCLTHTGLSRGCRCNPLGAVNPSAARPRPFHSGCPVGAVVALLLVVTGGFLPGFLRAATPGEIESRLREAIRMPQVNLQLNFGFTSRQGLEAWDPMIDPAAEISRLEQAMVQSEADAERWLKISRLRGELQDEAGAQAANDRGLALLRERLKAKPDDARAMSALGDALPTDEAEAERLLRGAVSRAQIGRAHV